MGVMIFRPGQRLVIPGVQVFAPRGTSAVASGILDGISNVAAAYSLRKLRSAYAGSAVRVRRSSDSTEQDIGFDGSGEFDSATFSSFVSGGTGYVKTWYDQSGNGRDTTQATTGSQPSISLNAVNGKPALSADGTNDYLESASFSAIAHPNFHFAVWKTNNAGANQFVVDLASGATYDRSAAFVRSNQLVHSSGYFVNLGITRNAGFTSDTNWYIWTNYYLTTSSVTRRNGVAGNVEAVGDQGATAIKLFVRGNASEFFGGLFAEFIFMSALPTSTDHNTIGADMATRFGLSWTTVT